jgi:hypothetical protein
VYDFVIFLQAEFVGRRAGSEDLNDHTTAVCIGKPLIGNNLTEIAGKFLHIPILRRIEFDSAGCRPSIGERDQHPVGAIGIHGAERHPSRFGFGCGNH